MIFFLFVFNGINRKLGKKHLVFGRHVQLRKWKLSGCCNRSIDPSVVGLFRCSWLTRCEGI